MTAFLTEKASENGAFFLAFSVKYVMIEEKRRRLRDEEFYSWY